MNDVPVVGLANDALVMQGQCVFEDHADRVVMRTPQEPDYWHGNLIAMKEPPGDARAQVAQFDVDFLDPRRVSWPRSHS